MKKYYSWCAKEGLKKIINPIRYKEKDKLIKKKIRESREIRLERKYDLFDTHKKIKEIPRMKKTIQWDQSEI